LKGAATVTRRGFNLIVVFALTVLGQTQSQSKISVVGVGGTFPLPLYSRWITEYGRLHPATEIRYMPAGSSEGIRQTAIGTADFGATDAPMTDVELAGAKRKLLHLPSVIGAVVPIYNLPGTTRDLRFTPEALAGIYLGKIAKWNDPVVAACNPDVRLPDENIVVVHRGDPSGTTYIWTDYLSKISSEWKLRVGKGVSVSWPVGRGSAKGSGALAAMVSQTLYSIGYVELTFARQQNIRFGEVRNAAGKFVKADLNSLKAAASAGGQQGELREFRISLTNTSCINCYPIVSFTWLLIPRELPSEKKRALKSFVGWGLTSGQDFATQMDYAPLPKQVVEKELIALSEL
jgi:phosphate transport system substrate-binding protein